MKKGVPLIVLGIILLIGSFLIPFHLFLPAWMSWSGIEELDPGEHKGPSLGLFWGSIIIGMIQVSGGNEDVYLYIKDSVGESVFDPGTVYSGYSFIWAVPKTDSFSFNYDNSMSWFTSKTVRWTLELYPYNVVFMVFGIFLSVLGVFIALKEEKVFQRLKAWQVKRAEKPKVRRVKEPGYVREIVREVVKIRCPYCGNLYDETLDKCPYCGGKRG